MLYFIKSQKYLKIGYTKDKSTYNTRMKSYKTHNPNFKIIDVKVDGTKEDESKLHKLLSKYLYYTEWFHDCPEIYEIWNKYTKNMKKYDPFEHTKKKTKEAKDDLSISKRKELIEKDINDVFRDECIITGNEIKEILKDIYSYYGLKFYPQIKTLEQYGYSLTRFLDNHTFKYKITKISD